jgi:hypothetical protein
MKRAFAFAGVTMVIALATVWVMGRVFPTAADARALRFSAALAFVVQMVTFFVAKRLAKRNLMVGWGVGSALRLVTLAIYALVAVPALGLPRPAALLGFTVILFASMLIEPLLLGHAG